MFGSERCHTFHLSIEKHLSRFYHWVKLQCLTLWRRFVSRSQRRHIWALGPAWMSARDHRDELPGIKNRTCWIKLLSLLETECSPFPIGFFFNFSTEINSYSIWLDFICISTTWNNFMPLLQRKTSNSSWPSKGDGWEENFIFNREKPLNQTQSWRLFTDMVWVWGRKIGKEQNGQTYCDEGFKPYLDTG